MSGLSRGLLEPSPACARRNTGFHHECGRMMRLVQDQLARGSTVVSGIALALLICAGFGPVSQASAQTIGSSYTSIAPAECRVAGRRASVDDSATWICAGMA